MPPDGNGFVFRVPRKPAASLEIEVVTSISGTESFAPAADILNPEWNGKRGLLQSSQNRILIPAELQIPWTEAALTVQAEDSQSAIPSIPITVRVRFELAAPARIAGFRVLPLGSALPPIAFEKRELRLEALFETPDRASRLAVSDLTPPSGASPGMRVGWRIGGDPGFELRSESGQLGERVTIPGSLIKTPFVEVDAWLEDALANPPRILQDTRYSCRLRVHPVPPPAPVSGADRVEPSNSSARPK